MAWEYEKARKQMLRKPEQLCEDAIALGMNRYLPLTSLNNQWTDGNVCDELVAELCGGKRSIAQIKLDREQQWMIVMA